MFVSSSVGANSIPVWVLTFEAGRLRIAEWADGDRAGERVRLTAGQARNWAQGYECRDLTGDDRLELIDYAADVASEERDGWTLRSWVYAWDGPNLRLVEETEPERFEGDWESDPRLDEIASDRCTELVPLGPTGLEDEAESD